MIDYLKKRPMICAAVGCVLSAVCGYYFSNLLYIFAVLSVSFLILGIVKKNAYAVIIFSITLLMIVSTESTVFKINKLEKLNGEKTEAEFILCDITTKSDTYYLGEIEVTKSPLLKKGSKISAWYKPNSMEIGQIGECEIELSLIDEDFKTRYFGIGVYLEGSISGIKITEKYDIVTLICEKVRKYIRTTLFGGMSFRSAATMSAVVFGDMGYFTNEFYYNVKASGVAHVMVVSGMHLSVLVTMVLRFAEKYFYNPLLRALIMFSTVIVLCGICGFTMSVLRASFTYIIMAAGIVLNRPYSPENALGIAVALILICSPFAILNAGFQLSVLSTFGILAIAIPINIFIENRCSKMNGFIFWFISNINLSLSATILTLPVLIYIFGYISVVAIITNLLISSAVTYCLCITVAAVLLSVIFPDLAKAILYFTDYGVRYINFVINYMGSWEYSVIKVPKVMAFLSVFLIFLVFWGLSACKKRIDMLKLIETNKKVKGEGSKSKWQLFMKRH